MTVAWKSCIVDNPCMQIICFCWQLHEIIGFWRYWSRGANPRLSGANYRTAPGRNLGKRDRVKWLRNICTKMSVVFDDIGSGMAVAWENGNHGLLLTAAWKSSLFVVICMQIKRLLAPGWQMHENHWLLTTVAWKSFVFADSCMKIMVFDDTGSGVAYA